MSYIRGRNAVPLTQLSLKRFSGLNRSENASVNEMEDMQNLSSDKYPYLSPRKSWKQMVYHAYNTDGTMAEFSNVRAIASTREDSPVYGFCGVIGTNFYYDGKQKTMKVPAVYENGTFKYGMAIAEDGNIQLLWANRILIIHGWDCLERKPYIYYYNTDDDGTNDDYVKSYEYKEKSYYTNYTMNIYEGGSATITHTFNTLAKYEGGYFDFKVGDSVFIDGYMTYSDSRWNKHSSVWVTSATVTEYTESMINQSNGLETWKIVLKLVLRNNKGKNPVRNDGMFNVYHIYKKIPYMTRLDIYKGRLWGANPNGEYIYGSALGELFDFGSFEGLSDDSVFLESSSQGGYLGVVSCRECLVAFKRNDMEVIYGEIPSEFAVGKYYSDCGCRSISSCVVTDGVLYYLNDNGIYAWNGSHPKKISEALDKKYITGFGYTDGIKYYISLKDANRKCETLCYTPRYGMWHRLDGIYTDGAFRRNGKLYILRENKVYETDSGEESVNWYMDGTKYFSDEYSMENVCELWILGKLDKDSRIKVYTSVDDGEWKYSGSISGKDKRRIYRLPVRLEEGYYWRCRLEGSGEFVIYGIKAVVSGGGEIYSNERINE